MEMNEEFEHLRFTDCLVTIDQLVKKYSKPDKKNKCLSEVEQKVVKCFKAGCLASLGRYHEAHSIICNLIFMQRRLVILKICLWLGRIIPICWLPFLNSLGMVERRI